jgi:hypothetical protein
MDSSPDLPASSTLEAFLAPGLDRARFIAAWLRAREIPHTVVPLAGRRHVVIRFAPSAYDPLFRMKTLVAHYDRAPGTPGANDNSAACFQLMLFAERLARRDRERAEGHGQAHNVRIIFTDGEEAAGTKGIAGQGAYALGSGLRKLKMTEDDVYVLDATGRGDALVLSTACVAKKKRAARPAALGARLAALHESATRIAQDAAAGSWMSLLTPYSDDAGFLAAGIAAQVVTVLPRLEAETLARALAAGNPEGAQPGTGPGREEIERAVSLNRKLPSGSPLADIIPETWRLMHTPADCARTLTSDAFALMSRFLDALASSTEIAL